MSGQYVNCQKCGAPVEPGRHYIEHTAACGGVQSECDHLRQRVAELEAIVARLPKTADGVPVTETGGVVYASKTSSGGSIVALHITYDGSQPEAWCGQNGYFYDAECWPLGECYSTRQAVEAADAAGGEG